MLCSLLMCWFSEEITVFILRVEKSSEQTRLRCLAYFFTLNIGTADFFEMPRLSQCATSRKVAVSRPDEVKF
jgi:hypothetical protein